MKRILALAVALTAATVAAWVSAAPPAPSSSVPVPDSSSSPAKTWASCTEYLPDGAIKPTIETHFPPNGTSGYELRLLVVISHGRGETPLPAGFHLDRASDAMRAIEEAKFHIPEPGGGSPPIIDRPKRGELENESNKSVTTTLSLPFVALPDKPGRNHLLLPPLPIAIGRANGQVMTLCTEPRTIIIEDPIANEADPKIHPNAPPRPQREEWLLAKQMAIAALAVVVLAALGAWLLYRWSKRPKPAAVRPLVPPWVAAMRELQEIRAAGLLDQGQLDVFVDRVDDCVRRYLGERYGFDGIESTSEEIRRLLARVYPAVPERGSIDTFLDDTDLVKFAKATPAREDCEQFIARAEQIVASTVPPNVRRREQERRAA